MGKKKALSLCPHQGIWLWTLFLILVLNAAISASEPGHTDQPIKRGVDLIPSTESSKDPIPDSVGDPSGLVNTETLEPFKTLARELSMDREWIQNKTLRTLDDLSLRLDELFSAAPRYFKRGDRYYEIKLDKMGELWADFDPTSDRFFVYLTHELFSEPDENRVLGFMDGQESHFFADDLAHIPAVGITVSESSIQEVEETLKKSDITNDIGMSFALGDPHLEIDRGEIFEHGEFATKSVRSVTCNSFNIASCGAGFDLYYVLTALRIEKDHEGFGRGKPEIELYAFTSSTDLSGSLSNLTTPMIFSGRTIKDGAGRYRSLPDINKKNKWYSISGGVAIAMTPDLILTMIEDDNASGELLSAEDEMKIINHLALTLRQTQVVDIAAELGVVHYLLKAFDFWYLGSGDDFFHESLGYAPTLICNASPNRQTFTLNAGEWDAQGHFACISRSPLSTLISGPSWLNVGQTGSFSAQPRNGFSPYTYRWTKNGSYLGSRSTVSTSSSLSFELSLTVTDDVGQTATTSRWIQVGGSDPY